jgi:hypothetical protein
MYGDTLIYVFAAGDRAEQSNIGVSIQDTIVIGFEDFENGLWAWQSDSAGTWGVESVEPYSGQLRLADSPGGLPQPETVSTLTYRYPLDLSTTDYMELSFWVQSSLRFGKDFCYVEVSADSGETWTVLEQLAGKKASWKQVVVEMTETVGSGFEHVLLRLRLETQSGDINENFPGVFMDDISLREDVAVTADQPQVEAVPEYFALEQNYPNPFNPSTHIAYQMPQTEWVSLEIYNTLGQRIRTLVDRSQNAGYHEVVWNGTDDTGHVVASGMYFYRLRAGNFNQIHKLLLLK